MMINSVTTNYQAFGRNTKTNKLHSGGRQPVPIYTIDENGECKRYDSIAQVAHEMGKMRQWASSALRDGHKFNGVIIKKAQDLEDSQGNLDSEKVKMAILTQPVKHVSPKKAVYAISPDGEIKRYQSISSMAEDLDCLASTISADIKAGYKVRGFIVKKASDLEDENGKIDYSKIKTIADRNRAIANQEVTVIAPSKKPHKKSVDQAIYAINTKTKQILKFPSIKTAAGVFALPYKSLDYFIKNNRLAINNYRLVSAASVEDKDGNPIKEKLKSYMA